MRFLRLATTAFAAALIFGSALPATAQAKSTQKKPVVHRTSKKKPAAKPTPERPMYGPDGVPIVRAVSAIVVDAITGRILHEKNADELRPPASTQKLLTALVILDTGDLFSQVRVEPVDTDTEPVKLGIQPGETYSRMELLQILLVHSPNDVARCLARDNAGSIEAS
jgi:D-alanyl-D-alanine carboxypeptidase (penicillin-binding protein 5/6)